MNFNFKLPKGAAHKSILSRKASIGRFQIPHPLPPKCPIENRCNFSDHEKISNCCFATYQIGLNAYEVISDVLSLTILKKKQTRYFTNVKILSRTNKIYSKQKLQNKVSCRKFLVEMLIKQNFENVHSFYPSPQTSTGHFA